MGFDLSNTFLKDKANFRFNNPTTIQFADSKTMIGLQVADILAGFCMRFIRDFKASKTKEIESFKDLFVYIRCLKFFW